MDKPPEWIVTLIDEQIMDANVSMRVAKTTEQLWSVQGRITALLALKDEFDLRMAEAANAEKAAAESWTTPHA